MFLKTDKIVATLYGTDSSRDVVMRSSRLGHAKEFILDPTAVTGWKDGTNVRRDNTSRLISHGDFHEPATMSSRLISFTGTAIANTVVGLHEMRDIFTGMLSNGSYTTLSVETSTGTRSASVGLEGTTSWIQQTDRVATWRISLYAPDPHLYGEYKTVQTGAGAVTKGGLLYPLDYTGGLSYNLIGGVDLSQTIKNNGNAKSWPIAVVNGKFYDGFSIYDNKGSVVTYTGMVTQSSPVKIDMGRGIATQLGVDKTAFVVRREWFGIDPGETITPEFIPVTNDSVGTGWCDILYRDTWI